MEEKATVTVTINGLEEAIEKAGRYVDLLKEAKTLASELASLEFDITSH